ncbi:NUDIX hydrolase [Streptomyces sp. NBC_00280]|uniref:NUDIX hydrolase n=1 Tax=Streptomyces sp. NBC_00280 TaxID=2975699 RepID=UPI00324D570E
MSVREDQIIRELSHYIHEHPDEKMALMPVYDAARDHAVQRGTCTHSRRCPLVTTGAVVVDERDHVLSLRHEGAFALAEAEPEEQDDSLSGAAVRLLAEAVGVHEVWTEPDSEGPFLIDVTGAGQHRYGPRLRIGFRYLFRAHSGAIAPGVIEAGAAAWMPLGEIGIPSVRSRLHGHLVGAR